MTWNAVDDAIGYKVQWKSGSETYPTSDLASTTRGQATIAGGRTTTYDISGLTPGTTYTIRVIATHTTTAANSAPSDAVMGTPQRSDYDSDGDGLIDITTLAQLNAIRWDLNGDGVVADSDTMNYNAAFPGRDTTSSGRMGCPSGTCTGYELFASLDFDSDGDGDVDASDHSGAYWDGGAGWRAHRYTNRRIREQFQGQRSHYQQPVHQPQHHQSPRAVRRR